MKYIVTKLPAYGDRQFTAWIKHDRIVQLDVEEPEDQKLLNRIYIGKIINIVKNIQSAFVEIEGGQMVYMTMNDLQKAMTAKEAAGEAVKEIVFKPGMDVIIQVNKEALKTKFPGATGELSIPGRALVLTFGTPRLAISGKISPDKKRQMKEMYADLVEGNTGFIMRTQSADMPEEQVREEAAKLKDELREIIRKAASLTSFSCIWTPKENHESLLDKIPKTDLEEIVTDLPEVYEHLKADEDLPVRMYRDALLPLYKLYAIESAIEEAHKERIWLKSGGYIIIQPTEALTVIDVNTGRYDGRRMMRDTFLKINLEAAFESARQIRLRNLSGIILIDFIDMEEEEDVLAVARTLRAEFKSDPVKTVFVDFTRLGIAEITRKKIRKLLTVQLGEGTGE